MTYKETFSALADDTRRQVLEQLASGPKSVGEIAALMPVSRPAVSQHLSRLKKARLVNEKRDGVRRFYSVDPEGLRHLQSWLDDFWGDALSNLKTLSEAEHAKRKGRARAHRQDN